DARVRLVEVGRDLDHHGDVLGAGTVVVVGEPLVAGDHSLPQRVVAAGVDVGTVEHAVTTAGGDIHQRAVVPVDRQRTEHRCGWRGGVGETRHRGRAEAGLAEAAGEEIVGASVVGVLDDGARHEGGQRVVVGGGVAAGEGK